MCKSTKPKITVRKFIQYKYGCYDTLHKSVNRDLLTWIFDIEIESRSMGIPKFNKTHKKLADGFSRIIGPIQK